MEFIFGDISYLNAPVGIAEWFDSQISFSNAAGHGEEVDKLILDHVGLLLVRADLKNVWSRSGVRLSGDQVFSNAVGLTEATGNLEKVLDKIRNSNVNLAIDLDCLSDLLGVDGDSGNQGIPDLVGGSDSSEEVNGSFDVIVDLELMETIVLETLQDPVALRSGTDRCAHSSLNASETEMAAWVETGSANGPRVQSRHWVTGSSTDWVHSASQRVPGCCAHLQSRIPRRAKTKGGLSRERRARDSRSQTSQSSAALGGKEGIHAVSGHSSAALGGKKRVDTVSGRAKSSESREFGSSDQRIESTRCRETRRKPSLETRSEKGIPPSGC